MYLGLPFEGRKGDMLSEVGELVTGRDLGGFGR